VQAQAGLDRFLTAAFGDTDPYSNVGKIKAKGKSMPPPASPVTGGPVPPTAPDAPVAK
jgi:hypothetical protein